ncbi:MFS transporter [Elioraea sp.]|uniref:MFS transporter n=1 Tax=Elioraea sp. TaxID=2185103 RepID=UPI003F709D43
MIGLLRLPDYRRLWLLGAIANVMRWLELLASGLYVLDLTGSAGIVALMAASRSLPLLLLGPIAGAIAEAVDRRRLLQLGLLATLANAVAMALLARAGVLNPWHIGIGSFVSGLLWSTELSTRRRMLAESAGVAAMPRAIALDAMTNATTRMLGPVFGGLAYQTLGLAGAFAVSACGALVAIVLAARVGVRQTVQPFRLGTVTRGLAEGIALALAHPAVLGVLGITVSMNMLAFSYLALIAPIGRALFDASPLEVGILAAAEPAGALIGGLMLARFGDRVDGARAFLCGSLGFLAALAAMPAMPLLALAILLLVVGGIGIAAFGTFQTTLVLTAVPTEARSRMLGLVTMAIGTGPIGMMLSGALAERFGAGFAVSALALAGLVIVAVVGLLWLRGRRE